MMDDTNLTWQPAAAAWTGGTVTDITLSPSVADDGVILAATAAGIYRSADGGHSWSLSMQGIDEPAIQLVRFAPAGWTAFAASGQGRLYRATDAGVTWQELTSWAGLGVASALACSPAYGDDRTFFVATVDGVYRTLDDGRSWESCTFGLLDPDVLCLACAPDFAASQVLWAGAAQGGFYRSRNAGRAWRDSGVGLPDAAIQCLILSPDHAADTTMYVGTEGAGLYRSTDGGATWHLHGDALAAASVICLAILPGAGLLAGTDAGLLRSADGGFTWLPVEGGQAIALALVAGGGIAAAATYQQGVRLATDGGRSFVAGNDGLCAHLPPLAISLPGAGLALLDGDGQLALWDGRAGLAPWPGEQSVTVRASAACHGADALFLVVDDALWVGPAAALDSGDWDILELPVADAASVAGLRALCGEGGQPWLLLGDVDGGLYLSAGGSVWRPLPSPWQGEAVLQAELWSGDAQGCHLAAVTAAPNARGNYGVNLWESMDSGERWTALASLETEAPGVLLATASTADERSLFVATRHRVITLRWSAGAAEPAVSQHLFATGVRITALCVSPSYVQDRTVYAAGSDGIYRSRDGGVSWHPYGVSPSFEPVVGILAGAATEAGPLLVTLGGRTWRPA